MLNRALESSSLQLPAGVEPNISHRAKRLSLKLDPAKGIIRLTVPVTCSNRQALSFVDKHMDWIDQRLNELPSALPFSHGSIIPILGSDRQITVQDGIGRTTHIELTPDKLVVQTKRPDPSSNIKRYLKQLAQDELEKLAYEKAAHIHKAIRSVTLRDPKSRWGSCTSDGDIMFSWRLIFTPIEVMDYVVAHEVAHLKHMDHSPRFWQVCEKLSANFSVGHPWLKHHGNTIIRIGEAY